MQYYIIFNDKLLNGKPIDDYEVEIDLTEVDDQTIFEIKKWFDSAWDESGRTLAYKKDYTRDLTYFQTDGKLGGIFLSTYVKNIEEDISCVIKFDYYSYGPGNHWKTLIRKYKLEKILNRDVDNKQSKSNLK